DRRTAGIPGRPGRTPASSGRPTSSRAVSPDAAAPWRPAERSRVLQRGRRWQEGMGRVLLTLKAEWSDGTTHLLFEPIELLERLAALTPRPRINLVLYHGLLRRTVGGAPGRSPTGGTPSPPSVATLRSRARRQLRPFHRAHGRSTADWRRVARRTAIPS